jgi:hypothetical protein
VQRKRIGGSRRMAITDLEALARRLERVPEVEAAVYQTPADRSPYVELIVEGSKIGPHVLLVIALHYASIEECVGTFDGEFRAVTVR